MTAPPSHNPVTETPAAKPTEAAAHFRAPLQFETDCWDVHEALKLAEPEFVLLDVRSPERYESGHIRSAVNLPHRRLVERNLEAYDQDTMFVVYCAGPHCNAADKAALRLAQLGRPVKKMAGGIEGWKDEGFALCSS